LQQKEKAKVGGGHEKIARQHQAGHYTARERIDKLVDPTTVLELAMLAHSDQAEEESKSAADEGITGGAKVKARAIALQAADNIVIAGTEGMVYFRKTKAIHEFAMKRGITLVNLMEGGGLRMPDGMGSDGISQMLFPNDLLLHHRKVPMVTAILGDTF